MDDHRVCSSCQHLENNTLERRPSKCKAMGMEIFNPDMAWCDDWKEADFFTAWEDEIMRKPWVTGI